MLVIELSDLVDFVLLLFLSFFVGGILQYESLILFSQCVKVTGQFILLQLNLLYHNIVILLQKVEFVTGLFRL